MNYKYKNPFTCFLDKLNIKHTLFYSEKLFNEHPNKNNLLGLSQMLSEYNIVNGGIRVDDKKTFDLASIKPPFVAQMGTGFAVVTRVSNNKINCNLNNLDIIIDVNEFKRSWTGILLLAEPDENSNEPNYKLNKRESLLATLKFKLLVGLIIGFFIMGFIKTQPMSLYIISLALVNLFGMYVSYLLVLKQLHIHNTYADKICSILNQGDCNDLLDTEAAKFLGTFSWSEIGLGYFISNLIILAFAPSLIPYMYIVNLLALPYSFWSIWYQKYKAKQWCPLCVMVQLILWGIFIINIFFGNMSQTDLNWSDVIYSIFIFLFPILTINFLCKLITESKISRSYKYAFNSMKFTDEVFTAVLALQPYYDINSDTSQIIFGNPKAKCRITIFSNPHCNPCARMHKKVHKLLSESEDILIQYIFCSFGPEWEDSSKHLLAIYLNNDLKKAANAYDEWFETGKDNIDDFVRKYSDNIDSDLVQNEYSKHIEWANINSMSSTPTVFINGYLLPNQYTIEDMKFFGSIGFPSINS